MIEVICDVMLCSLVDDYQYSLRTCCLHCKGETVSSTVKMVVENSSTFKMETAGYTKILVPINQTTFHDFTFKEHK